MNGTDSDAVRAPDLPQPHVGRKPTPQKTNAPSRSGAAGWLVPAALILLSALPIAAGAFRLTELAGGAEITPANDRFFASPLPVALHIVSVTLYALLGAFQFVPSLRRRRQGWHRAAGKLLIPSGLLAKLARSAIAALSGLWMAQFYRLPAYDGALVYGLRLLFGSTMVLSLLLGAAAIRRRDVVQHGAWMLRGYALGLGAGTQVITGLAAAVIVDPPSKLSRAFQMGGAWVMTLRVGA